MEPEISSGIFGKGDVHLLYKGIFEDVSVLALDGDFCVFY